MNNDNVILAAQFCVHSYRRRRRACADRVRKVFQHRAAFSPRVSDSLARVCARHVRNLQSLEILLVAPWKMYDALLLKASKREFQCLDISSLCTLPTSRLSPYSADSALRIHPRPSSSRNTVTSSNHPARAGKVGINVNRMSVRVRERRLCDGVSKASFRFGLYAIFAAVEFPFPPSVIPYVAPYLRFLSFRRRMCRKRDACGVSDETKGLNVMMTREKSNVSCM